MMDCRVKPGNEEFCFRLGRTCPQIYTGLRATKPLAMNE